MRSAHCQRQGGKGPDPLQEPAGDGKPAGPCGSRTDIPIPSTRSLAGSWSRVPSAAGRPQELFDRCPRPAWLICSSLVLPDSSSFPARSARCPRAAPLCRERARLRHRRCSSSSVLLSACPARTARELRGHPLEWGMDPPCRQSPPGAARAPGAAKSSPWGCSSNRFRARGALPGASRPVRGAGWRWLRKGGGISSLKAAIFPPPLSSLAPGV